MTPDGRSQQGARQSMPDDRSDRWNFGVLLGQGVAKSVGSQLSSEKLVLPFLYAGLGGPVLFAGMLMPIANLAKLGSQLLGAPVIEVSRLGKWYLAATTVITAVALTCVTLTAGTLSAAWLAALFLPVAAILGLSEGFGALTFQDMLGRVLKGESRGSLLFAMGAAAGIVTMIVAFGSTFLSTAEGARDVHLELVWAGIAMYLLASLAMIPVREAPKHPVQIATAGKESIGEEHYLETLLTGLGVVWHLPWYRQFLVALLLFLSVELVVPFAAIHAARFHADTALSLSMFVVASSIGMVIGGLLWPRVGRKSIKLVMTLAPLVTCAALLITFLAHVFPSFESPFSHAATFGLLAIGAQGVLNGRTVYVVSAATEDQRPFCVAVANFTMGVVGLGLALAAGTVAHIQGIFVALMLLMAANVAAAIYVARLPDLPEDEGEDSPQESVVAR